MANQSSPFANIIDLATGQVSRVTTPEGAHGAAVSADGRLGVISIYEPIVRRTPQGNTLVVIDLAAARVLRTIDLGNHRGPHGIAFLSGSSTQVAVTTQTSLEVVIVDLETGTVVAAIPTHAGGSHMLAMSADGSTLFTANEQDTTISRIDLRARAFAGEFGVGGEPFGIHVTPDGREVWVGVGREAGVRVLDANTGAILASIGGFNQVEPIHFAEKGRLALIGDSGCGLVLTDAPTREVLGVIDGTKMVHSVDVGPDGRTAFVTTARGEVLVVDLLAREVLQRFRTGGTPDGVAWGRTD